MNQLDGLELRAVTTARTAGALTCHYSGQGGCECVCDLVILTAGGRTVVLFSERPDNAGTSITNWYEKLATEVYRQLLPRVAPESITWLERYPADAATHTVETVDRVALEWDGRVFKSARWICVALDQEAA